MPITHEDITGLVLAGGRGSRMGGVDKGLQNFNGMPMALRTLLRLQMQVGQVIINANRNLAAYESFGVEVWPDVLADYPGPLAGFLTGLERCDTTYLVTVPCDSPFLPTDLVFRLEKNLPGCDLAVAKTGDQAHPVFALMKREVRESLEAFLAQGGRKIDAWYAALKVVEVSFDDEADAFRNINTLEELKRE